MNQTDLILNSSISPAFILPILNPSPSANFNSEEYKYKKSCKICTIPLKITKLHSRHRLRQCKFCYDAVCDPCSSLKLSHPSHESEQRICVSCLNSTIKNSLRSNMDQQISNKRRESLTLLIKEKQEIFKIQKRVEELINLCDAKSNELLEKNKEIEKLKKEIENLQSVCCDNKEKFGIVKEYEKENRVLNELDEAIQENFRVLDECRKGVEFLDSRVKEEVEIVRKSEIVEVDTVENLNTQICFLHGLANTYKHDIEKLKIVEVKNKEKCFIL